MCYKAKQLQERFRDRLVFEILQSFSMNAARCSLPQDSQVFSNVIVPGIDLATRMNELIS